MRLTKSDVQGEPRASQVHQRLRHKVALRLVTPVFSGGKAKKLGTKALTPTKPRLQPQTRPCQDRGQGHRTFCHSIKRMSWVSLCFNSSYIQNVDQ